MDRSIEELIPFYALDALTDDERQLVESYLDAHPEARLELDEMAHSASVLPQGISPVEPPRHVKGALMARVHADVGARARTSKVEQPSRRETRFASLFPAFSLGVATLAMVWAVVLNVQLYRLQKQMALLNETLVSQPSSSVVTVSLSGTTAQPRAHGQLIADPTSHSAVLVIAGLGPLEAGKTYQVWLIDGGGPKSAGFLTVDANGQGLLILSADLTIGEFNSLGISIEPDGGSEQPTGEIVVLSDL